MAKGRLYTVEFHAVAVTAKVDLFDLAPASNKPISIVAFNLATTALGADAGDAQEELYSIRIIRGLATVGSGGTAATVNAVDGLTTATATTARTNDTTVAVVGGGSTVNLWSDGWNNRVPYYMPFTDEQELSCSSADTRIVIRLDDTPTDSIAISGTCWFRELL